MSNGTSPIHLLIQQDAIMITPHRDGQSSIQAWTYARHLGNSTNTTDLVYDSIAVNRTTVLHRTELTFFLPSATRPASIPPPFFGAVVGVEEVDEYWVTLHIVEFETEISAYLRLPIGRTDLSRLWRIRHFIIHRYRHYMKRFRQWRGSAHQTPRPSKYTLAGRTEVCPTFLRNVPVKHKSLL